MSNQTSATYEPKDGVSPSTSKRLLPSILKRYSFVTGFLTAVVLGLAWSGVANFALMGGHTQDSPSGKYSLSIMAPMTPTVGGTYSMTLINNTTGKVIRTAKVTLNSAEKTQPLRDRSVLMNWDATETRVDIVIDGESLTQIVVPASQP